LGKEGKKTLGGDKEKARSSGKEPIFDYLARGQAEEKEPKPRGRGENSEKKGPFFFGEKKRRGEG